jgi:SAM-dependent methyltransferase
MPKSLTETYGPLYANIFDDIYTKPDYTPEFINANLQPTNGSLRKVLDLGCGTGRNSLRLPYDITGVDLSPHMLAIAQHKLPQHRWEQGSIANFKLTETYDGAFMLGDILSYHTTNDEVILALQNIANHLRLGAKLLFDFWYSPAVLTHKPGVTNKQLGHATRKATSSLDYLINVCTVDYLFTSGDQIHQEQHRLRYFSMPEIYVFLALVGLSPVAVVPTPTEDDWHAVAAAIK